MLEWRGGRRGSGRGRRRGIIEPSILDEGRAS